MMDYHISREQSFLFVIDIQDRMNQSMASPDAVIKNTETLLSAAKAYGIPAVYTEQYPKGLGSTNPQILSLLQELHAAGEAKTAFNGYVPGIREKLDEFKASGRKKAIVTGIEAHICVFQTVRTLLEEGYDVFVPVDAVSSRSESNAQMALNMMQTMGAKLTTTESALFDLMGDAQDEHFKELQARIK